MDYSNCKYMNYYANMQVFRMKLSDLMGLRPQYGVNGGLSTRGHQRWPCRCVPS